MIYSIVVLYYISFLRINGKLYIEKSGEVAFGHDAGFILYFGERPKGARSNIALFYTFLD